MFQFYYDYWDYYVYYCCYQQVEYYGQCYYFVELWIVIQLSGDGFYNFVLYQVINQCNIYFMQDQKGKVVGLDLLQCYCLDDYGDCLVVGVVVNFGDDWYQ